MATPEETAAMEEQVRQQQKLLAQMRLEEQAQLEQDLAADPEGFEAPAEPSMEEALQADAVQAKVRSLSPDQRGLLADLEKRAQQDEVDRRDLLRNQLAAQLQTNSTNIDWTPLAASLKDWTGSDAPLIAAKSNAQMNQTNQARTNELFDQLTARGKPGGLTPRDILSQGSRQSRYEDSQEEKLETKLRTDLDKDIFDPISKRKEQFNLIDDAFNSNDYQQIWNVMSQFARGVSGEKGVLTDTDIARVMPRNVWGDVGKIKAYFSSTPSAEMDPKYIVKLRELVEKARSNASTVYRDRVNEKKKLYGASRSYEPLKMSGALDDMLSAANESVGAFGVSTYKAPKAAPKAAPMKAAPKQEKALEDMTDEELAAFEAQLSGK